MSDFIYCLVYADNADLAREEAHKIMKELDQRNQKYYGEYDTIYWRDPIRKERKDSVLQVSTKHCPCDDKRGLDLVDQIMATTQKHFEEEIVCLKYLMNKYSSTKLFNAKYKYVDETEIELDGQKVTLEDTPFEFWRYCSNILRGDRNLFDIFTDSIGRKEQIESVLNHKTHVMMTWDSNIKLPLWIVKIEIYYEASVIDVIRTPIAVLVSAADSKTALEIAGKSAKKIEEASNSYYEITDFERQDGEFVPSASQVSIPSFPAEDQKGLLVLQEYLKAMSSWIARDLDTIRNILDKYTNEGLYDTGHIYVLKDACKDLVNGNFRADGCLYYAEEYESGRVSCTQVVDPKFVEKMLASGSDEKIMGNRCSNPPQNPFWIVFFRYVGDKK